jgi:DDE superfamily endonuclease
MDIFARCQCLQPHVTATTLRQLSRMVWAILVMSGRVTMLGISRWAGPGGSYRTVQRFFSQALPWAMLFWVFFRQHVYRPEDSPRHNYLYISAELTRLTLGAPARRATVAGRDRIPASSVEERKCSYMRS